MADIKQTIQDFYRVAQSRDFARKYQFRVIEVLNKGATVFDQSDFVYATTATLPGKKIKTIDANYNGLNFRVPGTVEYNQSDAFAITFYSDVNSIARIKTENWITETFSDETTTGDSLLADASNLTLAQLDNEFEVVRTYKLFGIFPTEAGDIEYDMADGNEIATFQATFAYQFFRRDNEIGNVVNALG